MTVFERIKNLAKKNSKTIKQVTLDLNYSENYFYSLKSGKQPSAEKLNEIADYFNVSVDYLLGREESSNHQETELRKALENVMSFDGEELTENDKDAIIAYMMGRKGK